MDVDGKTFRTVFFLGAGASRGAISHVVLRRKRIKAPLNGDFFKVASTYARALGRNSQAQRRLRRIQDVFERDLPIHLPTMEDAFSLLYVAKDFPEIYNRGRGRRAVAGVRKELSDLVNLLFPILTLLDELAEPPTGYDRLATTLTEGDTIITLNYDTMVDSALHRHGWDPKVGYAITGDANKKVNWEALVVPRPLTVDLLKLHGSVNWFVRGNSSKLQKVFESKPVRITAPRTNSIAGFIRQIVPPMYGKVFEHDHWRQLWTRSFQALCKADVLVVIGSSLIDTDFHLRALLSQVARTRKKQSNKFKYVYLVDRAKVRNKWARVLRGSYNKLIADKTFEKFLHDRLGA
jgi:hypothetical protein